MERRHILLAVAVWSSGASAAGRTRVFRLGVLGANSEVLDKSFWTVTVDELAKRGYFEGRNLTFYMRFSERSGAEGLSAAASALVGLNVDAIVAVGGTAAALAAKNATARIPIIFPSSTDPVALGIVSSLARPGGNVTGTSISGADAMAKSLQYLGEAIGKLSRVAILFSTDTKRQPWFATHVGALRAAGEALGAHVELVEYASLSEAEPMFERLAAQRTAGICYIGQNNTTAEEAGLFSALAIKYRLPSVGAPEHGFLLVCSPSLEAAAKRAAYFVDRVLKGALPRDLPVEQVTTFRLLINTATAKSLGLTLPRALLLRADELLG